MYIFHFLVHNFVFMSVVPKSHYFHFSNLLDMIPRLYNVFHANLSRA